MLTRIRFSLWRLLLVAAAIIVVQQSRSWLGAQTPALASVLGVTPNLIAGMGLPFTWASKGGVTRGEHWRRCVVTVLALCAYEVLQGAGIGAGHLHFDPKDIAASVAGAGIAATAGWWLIKAPASG